MQRQHHQLRDNSQHRKLPVSGDPNSLHLVGNATGTDGLLTQTGKHCCPIEDFCSESGPDQFSFVSQQARGRAVQRNVSSPEGQAHVCRQVTAAQSHRGQRMAWRVHHAVYAGRNMHVVPLQAQPSVRTPDLHYMVAHGDRGSAGEESVRAQESMHGCHGTHHASEDDGI